MTFSKDVVDNVLLFFTTNVEAQLLLCETNYGVTIDRAVHFDIVTYKDEQYPLVVLYQEPVPYSMETISRDLKRFGFSLDIKDSRADLEKLRINLYGYRDALAELIEYNKTLMGICVQAYINEIKPPLVLGEPGNYTGVMEINFTVEIIG